MTTSPTVSLTPGKRVLFLTKDADLIRRLTAAALILRIDPSQPDTGLAERDLSSYTIGLVPCFRYKWFLGCGVAHFGFSFVQGPTGPSMPKNDATTALLAVGPRVGVEIPLGDGRAPLNLKALGGESASPGQRIVLSLRPEDIALHLQAPAAQSRVNLIEAEVIP